jgi:AcrR family transcriptional regulator
MSGLTAPKQSRSRRTLERIVAAGLALLEEGGPDAVTVQAVVARARSSVGSFYARFKGKDDLLAHLRDQVRESAATRWAETVDREAWEASLPGMVTRAVGLLLDSRPDYDERIRAADRLVADGEDDEPRRKALAELVGRLLQRREEITHPNPELAVRIGLSAVLGVAEHARTTSTTASDVDAEELREECVKLLLAYLTGRGRDEIGSVEFFDVWG